MQLAANNELMNLFDSIRDGWMMLVNLQLFLSLQHKWWIVVWATPIEEAMEFIEQGLIEVYLI
jgi:hypothetical protein